MRILILAAQYPDTLACGYRGRLVKHIQGYHRHGHKVDLMAFCHSPEAELNRGLVEPYCENVSLFQAASLPSWRSPRRWLTVLNPLDSGSLHCSSKAFVEQLRTRLSRQPPDVVLVDGYAMLHYRKHIGDIPCVAFPIDCVTAVLESLPSAGSLFHRVRLAVHAAKVRRMERSYGSYYASVFVAQPDIDRARQLSPDINAVRIPNGVDTDYFAPIDRAVDAETIVFHGSMCFPPNIEAATWFITKVWPGLKTRHPNARFFVVGTNPDAEIVAAARGDKGIVVTGSVPDVRPYLQCASVVVVPMQSGAGIKNKVLEGMAMAKAIVLTGLATAGIDHAIPGQHFVIADTPEEFVDAIHELWQNPDRAAGLGADARELVQSRYTWECTQDACEQVLRDALREGGRATNV